VITLLSIPTAYWYWHSLVRSPVGR